ncbi:hypothetical protein PHYBLDRAFT_68155 [Phycomyces blakesleeanus NRRL 1555(-)]|uniref:Uncharacterized protein n=1 Tax=Phycomyces blakesleeanus (strain ATCC 8743b / DSM 1359 / FGSC 10004 / NBRC 33097 / NRRL 1555) TaxID=763407 RepID=A0A167P0Y4_PHYB8|nr:hypothetical protein PHYBLDRAFT_68155 [Phycomyces blakesleeanus NRRL 1555(-)]OAD77036.1 hypothetical protein PHYBLDRAFT_68155 [Phycomyces blakesleeanus NRRL 1555(-)]|eukprot:XP_018295076.1 hypothetical protein PHYBLDRAFT_68155 [Phycomyces blakesleeanus NRRL 1555(-)]
MFFFLYHSGCPYISNTIIRSIIVIVSIVDNITKIVNIIISYCWSSVVFDSHINFYKTSPIKNTALISGANDKYRPKIFCAVALGIDQSLTSSGMIQIIRSYIGAQAEESHQDSTKIHSWEI